MRGAAASSGKKARTTEEKKELIVPYDLAKALDADDEDREAGEEEKAVEPAHQAEDAVFGFKPPAWWGPREGTIGQSYVFDENPTRFEAKEITAAKKFTAIPKSHADSTAGDDALLMVQSEGDEEPRRLTTHEWIFAKEKFIEDINSKAFKKAVLKDARLSVLGNPDPRLVHEYGSWFQGVNTEDVDELLFRIYGTSPKTNHTPILKLISMSCLTEGTTWIGCKRSGMQCFVYAWQSLIRTPIDYLRAAYGAHNLTVASTINKNTRQTKWTAMHKVYGHGDKVLSPGWVYESFIPRLKEFDARYPLADPAISRAKAVEGTARVRYKLAHRVDLFQDDVNKIAAEGYTRFVMNDAKASIDEWPDMITWLALVCGARKIELLSLSTFRPIEHVESELIDTSDHTAEKVVQHWVEQVGVAKKKDGVAAIYPKDYAGIYRVQKPLLAAVTTTEFLKVFEVARRGAWGFIEEKLSKPVASLNRSDVSAVCDRRLRTAFAKVWAKHRVLDEGALRAKKFSFHVLRAIYGKASWIMYGSRKMDLTVWLSSVLGHDITDISTAMYYQVINLIPPPHIASAAVTEELRALLARAREAEIAINEILAVTRRSVPAEASTPVELSDGTSVLPLRAVRGIERRKNEIETLEFLIVNGVPLTNANLRKLGFASRRIKEIRTEHG